MGDIVTEFGWNENKELHVVFSGGIEDWVSPLRTLVESENDLIADNGGYPYHFFKSDLVSWEVVDMAGT